MYGSYDINQFPGEHAFYHDPVSESYKYERKQRQTLSTLTLYPRTVCQYRLFVGIVVDDRIWLTIPLTAHDVSSVAAVVCVDGWFEKQGVEFFHFLLSCLYLTRLCI